MKINSITPFSSHQTSVNNSHPTRENDNFNHFYYDKAHIQTTVSYSKQNHNFKHWPRQGIHQTAVGCSEQNHNEFSITNRDEAHPQTAVGCWKQLHAWYENDNSNHFTLPWPLTVVTCYNAVIGIFLLDARFTHERRKWTSWDLG